MNQITRAFHSLKGATVKNAFFFAIVIFQAISKRPTLSAQLVQRIMHACTYSDAQTNPQGIAHLLLEEKRVQTIIFPSLLT